MARERRREREKHRNRERGREKDRDKDRNVRGRESKNSLHNKEKDGPFHVVNTTVTHNERDSLTHKECSWNSWLVKAGPGNGIHTRTLM